jgi:hypothetical protein
MDGDFSWMWILLAIFIFMSMAKGGKQSHRQRKLEERVARLDQAPPPPAPALTGPTRADVERLEQRVRVLERIVTDGGYTLASEIEALRDNRPTEAREIERSN